MFFASSYSLNRQARFRIIFPLVSISINTAIIDLHQFLALVYVKLTPTTFRRAYFSN